MNDGGTVQRGMGWLAMVTIGVLFAACGGAGKDAGHGAKAAASGTEEASLHSRAAAREKDEALAKAEPASVAPGDRAAYFDALTRYRVSRSGGMRRDESSEPRDPDPESVRKVLWLEQIVGRSDPT